MSITMDPLGTPPYLMENLGECQKNVHITYLFVTSIEGTPLFRGKEHFFWVPKPGFYLHSG